jgi:tetratricopeptide (TPR) repeat protein
VAERRLYLPMIGLLLILAEMLVRAGWNERRLASVMAAIIVVAGVLTWQRSFVWSSSMALWSDTVRKSPQKSRAHFGLATAEFAARRYGAAAKEYELAQGPEYDREGLFYSNWALALRGAGRLSEAIRVGRKAVELSPTAATFAHQAIYLAEDGDIQPALELLDRAEKADASYEPLYIERGDILMQTGRREQACAAFQRAWTLDPNDPSATKGLTTLRCAVAR